MAGADLSPILERIAPGDQLVVAGSTGEPTALLDAWRAERDRTRGLSILSCAVAGLNRFDVGEWHDSCDVRGLFMPPECADAYRAGRYHWLPISYGGFSRRLSDRLEPVDIVVVQLSPSNAEGLHSLGFSAEFMPQLLKQARTVLGIVNHAMPFLRNAPTIERDRLQAVCEVDTPLVRYNSGSVDEGAERIASLIADHVADGAALQAGIGKVPAALAQALRHKKRLRMQSGMLGDGFQMLAEAGALDPDWLHQGCAMVGSRDLYRWAAGREDFTIDGCDVTHDPAHLATVEGLVAVNSALEVDLHGQCNLEYVGGQPVSGCGGAPDFARAARLSASGLSIVALPATAARGKASRICARLSAPGVASLPRTDVDLVVTEQGVADLRGIDVEERARRLIAVAAPEFREDLVHAWAGAAQSRHH